MTKYILKRILRSLITIVIVFVVVFMLLRFMPLNGYFPDEMIKETDEQTRMAYLRNLGLLDHPIIQLGRFVKNLFKGDLGRSITVYPKVPITTLLAEKTPVTAFLGFWSMLLGIVAGLAMGLMMVRFRDRAGDAIGNGYIMIVRAVPSLIYLFFIQTIILNDISKKTIFALTFCSMCLCASESSSIMPNMLRSFTNGEKRTEKLRSACDI